MTKEKVIWPMAKVAGCERTIQVEVQVEEMAISKFAKVISESDPVTAA
jgi:hypothetical protein